MRTAILTACLLALLGLSGCLGDSEPEETHNEEHHEEPVEMVNETIAPVEPFITLEASTLTGEAPILIDITANGLQNDTAFYNLEIMGTVLANGTADQFPVIATVEIPFAGEYQVNLTATYQDEFGGIPLAESITIVLDGEPAPPPVGTPLGKHSLEGSGEVTIGLQGPLSCTQPAPLNTLNEFSHEFDVPAEFEGVASQGSKMDFVFTNGETTIDIDIAVFDPAGTNIGGSAHFEILDGPEAFSISGNYAPGTYTIQVTSCAALAGTYDYTVDIAMVST